MDEYSIPQREGLKWIAVDFDGTLAVNIWRPGQVHASIGDPLLENHAKLREAAARGWKIVIHTARPWADYELVESWLTLHDLPFKSIVMGKLLAHAYVDDKAIHADDPRWY